LIKAVKRDKRPIVLDRIDRLGRDTLETIYVAAELHYEYQVPLITAEHGEYDLDKIDDQLDLVLNAVIAGKSVKNRVRAAWKSIKLRFSDEKKWHSWFDKVPVGYQLSEEGWIEPAPHATEVIEAMIHDLLETETQSDTAKRIQKAASNKSLPTLSPESEASLATIEGEKVKRAFENSDYDPEEFDGPKLKRLLTNTVLTGEIRYPRNAEYEEQSSIEDSDLRIVSEDRFQEVNQFLERQEDKNSTDTSKNVDMETLQDLGLLLLAMDSVDVVRPVCPECERGMVRNGEAHEYPLNDGRLAHYWICPKYNEDNKSADVQRKVPKKKEWEALESHLEDEYTDKSDIVFLKICPPLE
jgi:hypothetical protein